MINPRRFVCVIIALFIILVSVETGVSKDEKDSFYEGDFTYIIGPGDVLQISVWRHPDLASTATVRPDGKISFLLTHDINAAGLTPNELKDALARALNKTVRDPRVAVNVIRFYSKKIFVLGEVERPGVYPYEGRMTVLEAVSRAGSYKETAVLKSIIIIRGAHTDTSQVGRLNLQDVLKGKDISDNILLEPGDIIFVPKSFIAKVDTFIDQFFTKTDPVLKYYLDLIDIDQRSPGSRLR
jgi:polysaccharide export outer membrane protein